jgi:ABC-type transport system involved in cytochrome c biogenesis permease subunit
VAGTISIITFWFAMALYVGATVLYVYFFLTKNRQLSWYATFLTGAGFIMQTISIIARWIATGHFPIDGAFNSLMLAAWGLVLVYFVVEHIIRIKVLGPLLVPAAFVLMALAQLAGAQIMPPVGDLLDNWRVWFHVILIMLANAGFAIAAAAALVYLLQERQIKRHKTNMVFRRLPSLAQADRLERIAIEWAYPAYTAALLLGILRAIEKAPQDAKLAAWWFDPRVMLAGVIWVVFGSYLVLRFRDSLSARQAAWLTLIGFVVVIVTAIVARTVVSGFHIFGVI